MNRVIVIGCPGGGKSTFSKKLNKITGIPLYHLDMIYHRPDRTTVSREEFDSKLQDILKQDRWIIDGNYGRTLKVRLDQCDTVFWLDYPLEVCLKGIEERRGKERDDMPWIETEPDEEFLDFVRNFKQTNNPDMEQLIKQAAGKEVHIFKSREDVEKYIRDLEVPIN